MDRLAVKFVPRCDERVHDQHSFHPYRSFAAQAL